MRIVFDTPGEPAVLHSEEFTPPAPAAGEVTIENRAIGVNFIDCYFRSGLYPLPSRCPGVEGCGVVSAVGPEVSDLKEGDRVIYYTQVGGAYATGVTLPAAQVMPVPDAIEDEIASTLILKGLTAWYLVKRSYRVQPGDTALVYAPVGGVGEVLTQWLVHLGATAIGVTSSDAKAEKALANGCSAVIRSHEDIAARARELTDGKGVHVAYDSVGRDTFKASLKSLRLHGTLVSYGAASGAIEPFSPNELATHGSLFLTRPTLFHFLNDRATFEEAAAELFELILAGTLTVSVNHQYPLAQAARAHAALEARETTGSTVLFP